MGYRSDYRSPIPRPYQRVNSELLRPYLSSVQPSAVPMGTQELELTIKGRDFHEENRVLMDQTDLRVLSVSPTEMKVLVPDHLLLAPGTRKIHMITGGRVHQPSLNFAEVMVTFGRRFNERWNGQKLSIEF
ncbi:MAG: IPT/TIG domain-containing protein [Acidobacteria bacterium]|nr:IPT/TIG domain-containing protein [Acidobacteriota bacterium]